MLASADGCKGGWLVVKSLSWPCESPPYMSICSDFRSLLEFTGDCERVVVDIPIGIPAGRRIRVCDLQAKDLLKTSGASSAVFLAPPRETFPARNPKMFQKLHRKAREKGAGLPVWGILGKIKEADASMEPEFQHRVLEFHPELGWLRVAGRYLGSKHTDTGLAKRRAVLRRYVPDFVKTSEWHARLGRAARLDDLLDAMIGLAAAEASLRSRTHRLPKGIKDVDDRGLSMEMWY
jgi:predicted RNase H-like nuclease